MTFIFLLFFLKTVTFQRDGLLLWAVEDLWRLLVEDNGLAIDVSPGRQTQGTDHPEQTSHPGDHFATEQIPVWAGQSRISGIVSPRCLLLLLASVSCCYSCVGGS